VSGGVHFESHMSPEGQLQQADQAHHAISGRVPKIMACKLRVMHLYSLAAPPSRQ
jgi:hypothetical protein